MADAAEAAEWSLCCLIVGSMLPELVGCHSFCALLQPHEIVASQDSARLSDYQRETPGQVFYGFHANSGKFMKRAADMVPDKLAILFKLCH